MLIEKNKSSLLIIDVQEKLVSVMPKPHTFIDNIIKLQKAAKALSIATCCSEQYPKGLGKTIKKIKENLDNNYLHLEKTEFSITRNELELIGLSHLIICGEILLNNILELLIAFLEKPEIICGSFCNSLIE